MPHIWGKKGDSMNKIVKRKHVSKAVAEGLTPGGEQSWMYQSIMFAMMRNKYSKSQLKSLVAIMAQMQQGIKDVIFNNARPEDQLDLFSTDEFVMKFGEELIDTNKEIVLKIPLSDFKCDKRRYGKLKDSLDQLATLPFYIPIKSLDGEEYTHVSGLCEVIRPKSYDRDVYIKMKKEVALKFISNEGGSMKFLDSVIDEAKHNYAMRMYFFIACWRGHEATCPRTVTWLRKWLMLEDEYPRWNMFYNCVLKKAEEELYRIAVVEGKGDLYFTTKKIYDKGSEVGEPDRLQFIIHTSETGKMFENTAQFRSRKQMISDFCHTSFGIKGSDLAAIMNKVTEDNVDKINTYLVELDMEEQQRLKEGKIDKLHRHAFTCIMHKLREWNDADAEVVESFVGKEHTCVPPEAAEPVATKVEQSTLSPEDAKKWSRVMNGLKDAIQEKDFKTWFAGDLLRLVSVNDGCLTCEVPSKTYVEDMEREFLGVLAGLLKKEWGDDLKLFYTLRK